MGGVIVVDRMTGNSFFYFFIPLIFLALSVVRSVLDENGGGGFHYNYSASIMEYLLSDHDHDLDL